MQQQMRRGRRLRGQWVVPLPAARAAHAPADTPAQPNLPVALFPADSCAKAGWEVYSLELCDHGVTIAVVQGGGGAARGPRPSGSSTSESLGRSGAQSDPDINSRLQPNLNTFWILYESKLFIKSTVLRCHDGVDGLIEK
ncbi:hypothetical protein MSG28_002538 [Choristoneura fumiferana]|uniref:Uncharacterized protein n=1 Tax=Choristoneura fumiferana TaxID=7141 RepID=A0ACC0JVY3_CHOFU|nr:hypothetical protein MSG28_002538 [Choristoneura fumiferana]